MGAKEVHTFSDGAQDDRTTGLFIRTLHQTDLQSLQRRPKVSFQAEDPSEARPAWEEAPESFHWSAVVSTLTKAPRTVSLTDRQLLLTVSCRTECCSAFTVIIYHVAPHSQHSGWFAGSKQFEFKLDKLAVCLVFVCLQKSPLTFLDTDSYYLQ